jgi:hypothetical protein
MSSACSLLLQAWLPGFDDAGSIRRGLPLSISPVASTS